MMLMNHDSLAAAFCRRVPIAGNREEQIRAEVERMARDEDIACHLDDILQLAAYLGVTYVENNGGRWEARNYGSHTQCYIIDKDGQPVLNPLFIARNVCLGESDIGIYLELLE